MVSPGCILGRFTCCLARVWRSSSQNQLPEKVPHGGNVAYTHSDEMTILMFPRTVGRASVLTL